MDLKKTAEELGTNRRYLMKASVHFRRKYQAIKNEYARRNIPIDCKVIFRSAMSNLFNELFPKYNSYGNGKLYSIFMSTVSSLEKISRKREKARKDALNEKIRMRTDPEYARSKDPFYQELVRLGLSTDSYY